MGPPSPDRHVGSAVTILVLVASGVVAVNIKPIPLAAEVKVSADPVGAQIWVDGKLEGRAPLQVYVNPGQHRFESRAPGYVASPAIWQTFDDGGSGFVNVKLTPIPAVLQIVSDLTSGTLHLEGGRTELIPREGQIMLRMPVTSKSIELASGSIRVVMPIEIKPAMMPELNGNVLTANARVAAIAYGGGKAFVEASYSPVELYVDGKLVTTLISEGKEIPAIAPGLHRIRLVDGARIFERPITITEVPGIALLISAEQNLGNLTVNMNVEGAQILLDGTEFRASSTIGENFISNLRVRVVQVTARKEGYAMPEPLPVQLKRGETVAVSIELRKEQAQPAAVTPPAPPE